MTEISHLDLFSVRELYFYHIVAIIILGLSNASESNSSSYNSLPIQKKLVNMIFFGYL